MNNKSLEVGYAINKLLSPICEVYPIIADKGAKFPFIVYRRTALGEQNTKDLKTNGYIETATVEIVIASTKYIDSINLTQKAKDILERTRGTVEGVKIHRIKVINAVESWANDTYLQTLMTQIEIEK